MLIQQKIETVHLSSSQETVANYLLKEKQNIENMTIEEIAKASYTSSATLIRFAKKMGYDGFESFKKDYLEEIKYLQTHFKEVDANYPFTKEDNIQSIASKITILSKESMNDTLSLIKHDSLQKAIQIMKKANRIHLSAISYPLLIGQLFQLNMSRIGKVVEVNTIIGEELFSLQTMNQEDCLLMISYSGAIEKMITLGKRAKKKGIPIILITGLGDNELRKYADVVLSISSREKLYSKIGGFVNENSIKLILDILYACYFKDDYDNHLNKRIEISKQGEKHRNATYEVMKENEIK